MVILKLSFITTHICLLTLDIIYSFNACIMLLFLVTIQHDKEVDVFLKILDHDMSATRITVLSTFQIHCNSVNQNNKPVLYCLLSIVWLSPLTTAVFSRDRTSNTYVLCSQRLIYYLTGARCGRALLFCRSILVSIFFLFCFGIFLVR